MGTRYSIKTVTPLVSKSTAGCLRTPGGKEVRQEVKIEEDGSVVRQQE